MFLPSIIAEQKILWEAEMKFNEQLKLYRIRSGMSQKDFGSCIDVSRQTVLKWESGRYYPHLSKIGTICKTLDVSADDLLLCDEYNENSSYKNDLPEMLDACSVGNNIIKLRRHLELQPSSLSDISKVTRQTAARWEAGKTLPELYNVIALAKHFSVRVCDIIS